MAVRVIDGENVFEFIRHGIPETGNWFISVLGTVQRLGADIHYMGPVATILRPISGPCAQPDRRKDMDTRGVVPFSISGTPDILLLYRKAYRRGLDFAEKK